MGELIKDNIYFETNLSANAMVSFVREILQWYEIDESEIAIYIK